MRYNSLLKQAFIIAKSKWIFSVFKGKIFSISSFEIVNNLKKSVPELNFIIDVGANSGQFTKVVNHFYPTAKIKVFEPLPNLFINIKKMFEKHKNISLYNIAIGNEIGSLKFNQNQYGHISSFLEVHNENIHYSDVNKKSSKIEVEINTLDNIIKEEEIISPSLMKLDVQGFELEALKGSTKILKKLDYIIIEANLEELYKNQPSFSEINTYLNNNNFELLGMLDFNLGKKNKYIEIDILYQNKAL